MAVSALSCGANVARISAVALVRSLSGFMSSCAFGHWSIWGHLGAAVKRIFAGASPGLSVVLDSGWRRGSRGLGDRRGVSDIQRATEASQPRRSAAVLLFTCILRKAP